MVVFLFQSHSPEKLFSYHAGKITGLETSPVAHFVATCGLDGEPHHPSAVQSPAQPLGSPGCETLGPPRARDAPERLRRTLSAVWSVVVFVQSRHPVHFMTGWRFCVRQWNGLVNVTTVRDASVAEDFRHGTWILHHKSLSFVPYPAHIANEKPPFFFNRFAEAR